MNGQQVLSGRNHLSIEKMPKVTGGVRNNILSNSLQMLSGSDTIESRTRSIVASNALAPVVRVSDKSYHLRYVS